MKKLIIDANLLLLYVIGLVDKGEHICKSNRLNKYSKEDFDILIRLLEPFSEVYVTPYIATEVSNLIDLKGNVGERVYEVYKILLNNLLLQADCNFKEDSNSKFFTRFGLTDSSLTILINDYFILTDDEPLCGILYQLKVDNVLHFQVVKQLDSLM